MILLTVYSFKDWIEIISEIFTIIGIGALIYAYRSVILGKRSLSFDVMIRCIERYRSIDDNLKADPNNPKFINEYVKLVKEELFYIHRNYIDKQVAIEWIEGMISYLPVYDKNRNLVNSPKINPEKAVDAYQGNLRLNYFSNTNLQFVGSKAWAELNKKEKRELSIIMYKYVMKYKF